MNSELTHIEQLFGSLESIDKLLNSFSSQTHRDQLTIIQQKIGVMNDIVQDKTSIQAICEFSKMRMLKVSSFEIPEDKHINHQLCNLIDTRYELSFCINKLYETLKQDLIILTNSELLVKEADLPKGFLLDSTYIVVGDFPTFKHEPGTTPATSRMQKTPQRQTLSAETKQFLDRIFELQRFPNKKDREIISRKCGLSKVQVRVWVSIVLQPRWSF